MHNSLLNICLFINYLFTLRDFDILSFYDIVVYFLLTACLNEDFFKQICNKSMNEADVFERMVVRRDFWRNLNCTWLCIIFIRLSGEFNKMLNLSIGNSLTQTLYF